MKELSHGTRLHKLRFEKIRLERKMGILGSKGDKGFGHTD